MTALQTIRIPVLERLALAELAYRNDETEAETLARLVREAARAVLVQGEPATVGHGGDHAQAQPVA